MTPDLIQQARAEWAKIPHARDCASKDRKWVSGPAGILHGDTENAGKKCNCFHSRSVIPQVIDALAQSIRANSYNSSSSCKEQNAALKQAFTIGSITEDR